MGLEIASTNSSLQNIQPSIFFTNTSQPQTTVINPNQTNFTHLVAENAETYAARIKSVLQKVWDRFRIDPIYDSELTLFILNK